LFTASISIVVAREESLLWWKGTFQLCLSNAAQSYSGKRALCDRTSGFFLICSKTAAAAIPADVLTKNVFFPYFIY